MDLNVDEQELREAIAAEGVTLGELYDAIGELLFKEKVSPDCAVFLLAQGTTAASHRVRAVRATIPDSLPQFVMIGSMDLPAV